MRLLSGADQGCLAIQVTGVESEAGLPFAGLHQLLRPILSALGAVPPVHQRALRSAFGLEDGPVPDLFLTALAALSLVTEVAVTRPVVIVVDDLQWVDETTREVLAFLARRIGNDPVVILCARRAEYPDPFAGSMFGVLEVSGLDDSAARELLAQHAADLTTADREAVLRQAVGNPLALVELSAALREAERSGDDGGPPFIPLSARLERAFAARINEQPQFTRDAMLIAAVDPEGETSEILAATGVLSGAAVTLDVFEPAAASGMIDYDQVHVRFRHPLMRSGTLQAESSRQQAAHSALARYSSRTRTGGRGTGAVHRRPRRRDRRRARAQPRREHATRCRRRGDLAPGAFGAADLRPRDPRTSTPAGR